MSRCFAHELIGALARKVGHSLIRETDLTVNMCTNNYTFIWVLQSYS